MKKHILWTIFALGIGLLSACVGAPKGGPDAGHGLKSAFKGIAHLVLSPIQIAAGLAEGVASLPYYASTNIHAINEGLVKAQAKVTLDDTYDAAYGKRLNQVGAEGDTGELFRRMKHASKFFQKVLRQHGIPDAENYILTSIDTANRKGYTLFAVVYRPTKQMSVIDKYDGKTIRNFSSEDRLFYEPFKKDIHGKLLDTIIDWAGVPTDFYRTQKQQAVLLTLAANAVADGKRRLEYWDVEKRWIEGEFTAIMTTQNSKVQKSLGI